MANKKLKVGATSEVKLPEKKSKGEKKPKWQAKTGNTKAKKAILEPVVETEPVLPPEPTDAADVAPSSDAGVVEPTRTEEVATTHDGSASSETVTEPIVSEHQNQPVVSRSK